MFWSLASDASCPPEKSLLAEESSATAWDSNVPPLLILAAFRITCHIINVDSNWWRSMWLLFDVLHAFQEGGWGGRWFGSRILGEGEPGQIQFSTKKLSLELTDDSLPKGWECERGGTKVWEERQQWRREETTAACSQVEEKYLSEIWIGEIWLPQFTFEVKEPE